MRRNRAQRQQLYRDRGWDRIEPPSGVVLPPHRTYSVRAPLPGSAEEKADEQNADWASDDEKEQPPHKRSRPRRAPRANPSFRLTSDQEDSLPLSVVRKMRKGVALTDSEEDEVPLSVLKRYKNHRARRTIRKPQIKTTHKTTKTKKTKKPSRRSRSSFDYTAIPGNGPVVTGTDTDGVPLWYRKAWQ